MKRFIYLAGMSVLACNGQGLIDEASAASAQGLEEEGAPKKHRGFERDDKNSDGALTADEVPADKWAELSKADADGNGAVTKEEIKTAIDNGTLKRPGKGKGPHHSPEERFAKDDTNGDGSLSQEEAGDKWAFLKAADADGNGAVTLAELKAALENGALKPPKRPDFASLDSNGDGSIDATEAGDKWDHLSKADANADGLVTQAELEAARPKHPHHGH